MVTGPLPWQHPGPEARLSRPPRCRCMPDGGGRLAPATELAAGHLGCNFAGASQSGMDWPRPIGFNGHRTRSRPSHARLIREGNRQPIWFVLQPGVPPSPAAPTCLRRLLPDNRLRLCPGGPPPAKPPLARGYARTLSRLGTIGSEDRSRTRGNRDLSANRGTADKQWRHPTQPLARGERNHHSLDWGTVGLSAVPKTSR